MNQTWMKILALILTAAILTAIYAHIDLGAMGERILHVHPWYFGLALFLFIPQILVTCVRWRIMMREIRPMTLRESVQMVMAGKALNALVPSKLGEMSKAYFLKMGSQVDTGQSVSAVILEKVFDLGGLCAVLLLGAVLTAERTEAVWLGVFISVVTLVAIAGLLMVPLKTLGDRLVGMGGNLGKVGRLLTGWDGILAVWKRGGGRTLAIILLLSVFLWSLHVAQIYLFFPSLRYPVPVPPAMAYIPLAILVGLLPITLGGMGTRDTALILLFAPHADAVVAAGVGLFCTMRYWMDTLLGVPFFHWYSTRMGAASQRGAAGAPRDVV